MTEDELRTLKAHVSLFPPVKMLCVKLRHFEAFEEELLKERDALQAQLELTDKKLELVARAIDVIKLSRDDINDIDVELQNLL